MNEKFIIKAIQQGQTQKIHVVAGGAGIVGNALVINAAEGARYQLTNIVTLISPQNIQIKRKTNDLHLALPGGDVDAPDVVIKGYFDVKGASLWGASNDGVWSAYDTAPLSSTLASVNTAATAPDATGVTGAKQAASYDLSEKAVTSVLGESGSGAWAGNPWVWAGGAVALGAVGKGGGGGSSSGSSTDPLTILRHYADAANGGGVSVPTFTTYKDAGVKALSSLSDSTGSLDIDAANVKTKMGDTWLQALNSALDKQAGDGTLTVAKLQAMADSYYRILSEADGSVNTSSNVDVYPSDAANSDPLASDYVNIGVTVGNAKSVDLLNDYVGLSTKAAVDTVDEINVIAKAAYNIMQLAGATSATAAAGTAVPSLYSTTDNNAEWIKGLNTLLGLDTSTGVNANNITAIKKAIQDAADTGEGVDTVQEIKDLIKPTIASQKLKDFIADSSPIGSKTAPALSDYTDLGIKTFKSLTDTSDANRKKLNDSSTADGGTNNTFLTETILNTALNKLDAASLTKDKVQSMVDAYYRILSEADGDATKDVDVYADTANDATRANLSDPTLADYNALGVTVNDAISNGGTGNETLDLLNNAVGRLDKTMVGSATKLQALATTANDVMLLAKNSTASQNDADLIAGLNALLNLSTTTGVNRDNLSAFNAALAAKNDNGTETNTVDQLLGVLALVRLQSFTTDSGNYFATDATTLKSAEKPTLDDWTFAAGLTANTSLTDSTRVALNKADYWKTTNPTSGLQALNSALDTLSSDQVKAVDKLQSVVNAYGRILQEADGSRATNVDVSKIDGSTNDDVTQTDLETIGVKFSVGRLDNGTSVTDDTGLRYQHTGELVASIIGSLPSTSVDTIQKLNTLVDYATVVMKQAAGGVTFSYSDANWITAINSLLGTTTANVDNIADIKNQIAGAGGVANVDSWDELQALTSMVRLDHYAAQSTDWVAPVIGDYQAIMAKQLGATHYTDANSTTANYLTAYNSVVDAQPHITSGQAISDMIQSYNKVLDLADGVRSTTTPTAPTAGDYSKILGATAVVDDAVAGSQTNLLNSVIDGLSKDKVDTLTELNDLIAAVQKVQAWTASRTGGLDRQALGLLGLTDGNGHSVSSLYNTSSNSYWVNDLELANFINVQLADPNNGSQGIGFGKADTFEELQTLLGKAIIAA
jgi:hypothetical protein